MLELRPGASVRLGLWLLAAHVAAAVGGALWVRPGWVAVGVVVALGVSAVHELRTHAWRHAPGACVRVQAGADGQWTLTRRDGRAEGGYTLDGAGSFVQPWLVIVALRRGWRRRYLPLAADALAPAAHRALRLRLREPA